VAPRQHPLLQRRGGGRVVVVLRHPAPDAAAARRRRRRRRRGERGAGRHGAPRPRQEPVKAVAAPQESPNHHRIMLRGKNLARAPAHGGAPMPTRRSRIVEALCERGSWTRHACMGLLRGARSADDGSPVVRAREAGDWPALPAASTTTAAAAVARGRGGPGIFALLRALCARAWPASARRPQARARTIGLDASAANSRWGDGVVMLGSKPKLENQWQAGTRHC
jgi:hypothetical protein